MKLKVGPDVHTIAMCSTPKYGCSSYESHILRTSIHHDYAHAIAFDHRIGKMLSNFLKEDSEKVLYRDSV